MKNTARCIYCDKEIMHGSKHKGEHIIPFGLGGYPSSRKICCTACNNGIASSADAEFIKIFSPILGMSGNVRNVGSHKYTGKVKYRTQDGYECYDAVIKDNKISSCEEWSVKYRRAICENDALNFEIVSANFDFVMPNDTFKNGVAKIAINYAASLGINHQILSKNILRDGISMDDNGKLHGKLNYKTPVFPYIPLNEFDHIIENHHTTELVHILMLFSYKTFLVCYVELFSTFQQYVILSDKYVGNQICENYCQSVEVRGFTPYRPNYYRGKHIITDAMIHGIKSDDVKGGLFGIREGRDEEVENARDFVYCIEDRINNNIRKAPYSIELGDYVNRRYDLAEEIKAISRNETTPEKLSLLNYAVQFYIEQIPINEMNGEEEDEEYYEDFYELLSVEKYKKFTPTEKGDVVFYPLAVCRLCHDNDEIVSKYTTLKLENLISYLQKCKENAT